MWGSQVRGRARGRVVTGRVRVVVVVRVVVLLLLRLAAATAAAEVGERPADYGRVTQQAQITAAAAAVSATVRGSPTCKRP